MIACGAILGWTSPTLPRLTMMPGITDNVLNRPITKEEGSWLGSLVHLGVVAGSCFSGYIGERLGRKRGLLLSTFPFVVGWILVGLARSIVQMYIGRFILGFGISISLTILPVYIGEISEAGIRGSLGSFMQIFLSVGLLFVYVVGPYTSYLVLWLLCVSLHLCFFVGFFFIPESPYYLLSKGRKAEAVQSLARLRCKAITDVSEEVRLMQAEIEEAYRLQSSWMNLVKVAVNRRAVFLASMLMAFQDLAGVVVVLLYVEDIFLDAGTQDPVLSAIIIGLVQLVASTITPFFVDKYGRKILLFISSIGCGVTIGALGTYFYLQSIQYPLKDFHLVPVVCLIVFMLAYGIGWGPVPFTIAGEIFAPDIKSKAASVSIFVGSSFNFLIAKLFPTIAVAFGAHIGFWLFSLSCFMNIIFVYLYLPETRCKQLIEIQQSLRRGKN